MANRYVHTPGPWEVVNQGVYQARGGGREILFGQHNTRSATKEERMANAQLIAASPDLLAACKAALAFFDLEQSVHFERLHEAEAVEAICLFAIAKAEGK